MSRGGARNRSGPQRDESSRTSERAGFTLTALPPAGYDGEVPDFPLPEPTVREDELWNWAWTTPQACAWSTEPWRWHTVAMWVRTAFRCENPEATAADKSSLHRFADQIGLTPAGLKENGWKIAEPKPESTEGSAAPDASVTDIQDWLAGSGGA